jgi:predicted nucleic acid-binding Zn ribbon protein
MVRGSMCMAGRCVVSDNTGSDNNSPAGDKPVDSVDKSILGRSGSPSQPPPDGPRGADIARAALEAARAAGPRSGGAARRRAGGQGAAPRRRRGWSGAWADDRDPQTLGRLAARLVADRGWVDKVSSGVVFAKWAQLVGSELAEHAQPVSLRDGELTVQASSTAWATQLRLLQRHLVARITAGVGPGVVTRLRVQAPAAPSWHRGPRHVRGRGPRDTYG